MSDPARWSDGSPDAPVGARELLAQAGQPPPFDAALHARSAARLAEATAPRLASTSKVLFHWAVKVGGVGGAGLVALLLLGRGDHVPSARQYARHGAPSAAPAIAAPSRNVSRDDEPLHREAAQHGVGEGRDVPSVSSLPRGESVPEAAQPAESFSESTRRAPRRSADGAQARCLGDVVAHDETDLLGQAQRELDRRPSRALALALRHPRCFPHGQLADLRDYIVLRALVGMGRSREARARGEEFLRDYPHGIYTESVRRLLARLQ